MDEKELVKRVRKSFKAKKSRAEVLSGFQKRGYKLAYAEELIKFANRPKKIIAVTLLSCLFLFSVFLSINSFTIKDEKLEFQNPLSKLSFSSQASEEKSTETNEATKSATKSSSSNNNQQTKESIPINYNEIEITPDFIKFLLSEVGADSLHKSLFGREPATMNFYIEDKTFYSEIDKTIEVFEGKSETPDLEFHLDKRDLIDAVSSSNPEAKFKQSLEVGNSWMEMIAGEPELFAKGYLDLYNKLK